MKKNLFLILALAVTPILQPTMSQVSPAPASVQGAVLRAGTNDPIVRARVILNSPGASPRVTNTDNAGRFALRDVPAGRYQLLATHDGYVRTPVNVSVGSLLPEVVLSMTPTGAIAGRVLNRLGEPFPNVAVRALRVVYDAGRPTLAEVQMVRTNDLGEYRLYYLEPGQYFVSALPPLGVRMLGGESGRGMASVERLPGDGDSGASTVLPSGMFTTAGQIARFGFLSTADIGETYAPTFFPGTPEASGALAVRIDAGGAVSAIDFILAPVRAVTIRGQVTTASGQPQRGVAVVLLSSGGGDGSDGIPVDNYGSVSDSGAFEFRGVAPGVYDIVASVGRLPTGIPTFPVGFAGGSRIDRTRRQVAAPAANSVRLAGRASVRVGSVDLDRVAVTLHPGFTVNGRITVEGRSAADAESMTAGMIVQLQSDPPDIVPEHNPSLRVQTGSLPSTVGPGGAFSLQGVFPGTFRIALLSAVRLPPNAYVKSAQFGSRDALNPNLRIDDSPQGTLEIVVGTNPGKLDVVVSAPAPSVTVVLIPPAANAQHYDLYRAVALDRSGHALFDKVAPGEYTAYAFQDIRPGMEWDPEFVKKYEGRGKPIRIDGGGAHTLDLEMIPSEGGQR